jgi:hypothetical protein
MTDTHPPCPTPCDADCEAGCHEVHAEPHKRGHQPHGCHEIRVAIAGWVTVERERIRYLAVEHSATYDERSPCDCGRVDCTALIRSRVPFADLITEPPTEGPPK